MTVPMTTVVMMMVVVADVVCVCVCVCRPPTHGTNGGEQQRGAENPSTCMKKKSRKCRLWSRAEDERVRRGNVVAEVSCSGTRTGGYRRHVWMNGGGVISESEG